MLLVWEMKKEAAAAAGRSCHAYTAAAAAED